MALPMMAHPLMSSELDEAVMHYHAGRLDEAAKCFRQILALEPSHPEASHFLGIIHFQRGKFKEASLLLERAIASDRATAEMYNNYGAVLNALGELDQAAEAYRTALALQPHYPWAWNNLGCVYRDTKQTQRAVDAFRRAVALKPDFPEAETNLRSAYRDIVPAWHFAMMHDESRNDAYEGAISRACLNKRVLEIGTGAGLLAMLAARAGARSVATCEEIDVIADHAKQIIHLNRLSDRITVICKRSTDVVLGQDLSRRAEVLIAEIFSSNLLDEGILPAIEHAHDKLLTHDAVIIPQAASPMGFLIGGDYVGRTLFVDKVKDINLSLFNDFAPPVLALGLDGIPYEALSADTELLRFDFRERQFPMTSCAVQLFANRPGLCFGIAQWIRIELDKDTVLSTRPSSGGRHTHWSHLVYRFPKPIAVQSGDAIRVVARHDRKQINIDLIR